ncbi:MAG: metal ABC transporter ATP-binding protein [Ruminococcaceae bacterium]|nr:metal ABC transporter ATP-binding protein [Oscillospiraceae bacterium]
MSGCGLHCLKINHITVKAGGNTLVEDVSLHAHCGEITALIGRNGAGKSTLFRALLGEVPHSGEVVFTGHNGTPAKHKPRIGYVPQSLNLDEGSPATVLDLAVAYTSRWPAFLPVPGKLRRDIAAHFDKFEAADLLDKPAGRLSGGERQRVLLAIATRPHPDMLVLDEPVSGVDEAGLLRFYDLLEQLRQEDMVILLISHDLTYVRQHADRVVLLDQRVLVKGAPDEVFASPQFRQAFPKGGVR